MTTMTTTLTHDELIERGAAWLRGTHRCIVVLTEHTGSHEQPDVIGWNRRGQSILLECKCSRSDYHRDRRKPWRRDESQLPDDYHRAHGRQRFYLLDVGFGGLPRPLPEAWGFAWVRPTRVSVQIPAPVDPTWTPARDVVFLLRELQRFQLQGMRPRTWLEHRDRVDTPWHDIEDARRLMRLQA